MHHLEQHRLPTHVSEECIYVWMLINLASLTREFVLLMIYLVAK